METRPTSTVSKLLILIAAIFVISIVVLNIGKIISTGAYFYVLAVIPVVTFLLFLAARTNILPIPFVITIFLAALLLKGVFVILVNTAPVSDFSVFYSTALELVQGRKALEQNLYFKTWAYQTGPVIYYAGLIKIFGAGLLPLKLINCVFMAGSNTLIYLLARKVSKDFTARFVSLLYLFYPAPYLISSVLTNQHLAAFLFLAAIYVLLSTRINLITGAITGALLISFGNAVRPLGLLMVASVTLWCILRAFHDKSIARVIVATILIIVYIAGNTGLSYIVKFTGINTEGLQNNFPLWKFVIGLNHQSKGLYSYDDYKNIFLISDFQERNEKAINAIKERISVEPHKLAELLGNKVYIMWAEFDTLMWAFYKQVEGGLRAPPEVEKIEPMVLNFEKGFYLIIFILLGIGLISELTNRIVSAEFMLLSILLLCFFGIHLFIEIQVRYRYFAIIIIFILAARGSEFLFRFFRSYKKTIRA